jgi:hypothetical protein
MFVKMKLFYLSYFPNILTEKPFFAQKVIKNLSGSSLTGRIITGQGD